MSMRDELPAVLRGETASDLAPASRERLEALAGEALARGEIVKLRDECAARLRQPGASLGVEYLLGCACVLHGERERALQCFLTLGERLAQADSWEPLAAVAERALELDETGAGARLLVRAHEGLRQDPERIDALWRAWRILPDDLELGLLLAVRLGDARRHEDRRTLLAELLPRFAAEGRWEGLEEAALEFVEHEDLEGVQRMVKVLPQVAAQGAVKEARQLLEVAFGPLARANRAGDLEEDLRDVARHAAQQTPASAEAFRGPLVESVRQGSARALPDAPAVFAVAGLEDPLKPLIPALERYDRVAALPPGRAVLHGSFGAGRIQSDDGEVVIIDFTRSPGHRMPYDAARRSLTPLAEDDLRLLKFTDPDALQRLLKERPGDVLVRALQAMGGEADGQRLKLFLVGNGIVSGAAWTTTYRKLRGAAEADPRIDHGRAFEQTYSLGVEGAAPATEAPLPALEPRKALRANLATIRKFLTQHPDAETALAQRFGRYVERALHDEEGDRVDRARAGLYLSRWYPERAASWPQVLRGLWEQGLAVSDLSGEDEQLALLEVSRAAGVAGEAILSALDSRFSSVRERAAEMRDQLDPAGKESLRRILLDHAPRYPQAALRVIDEALAAASRPETPRPLPDDPWQLLWAALALIEERPKPSTAQAVLEWIAPEGPFERLLETESCPERHRLRLTVLLRQWRSSDRYLFPALDLAARIGLGDAVHAVQSAREASARKMFDQVGQQAEVDLPVMTRATWGRLKRELERMERELRTEIPRVIQRARELGDLKENAEYHSAKLKQANLGKQVAALQLRLLRARFVDDVQLDDGIAGPGTEVVLESADELTTYWILGEDEHHHGANVVSFQAPVGRALSGKTIGDEVVLGDRTYRVVSVARKLPAPEPHAAGAESAGAE